MQIIFRLLHSQHLNFCFFCKNNNKNSKSLDYSTFSLSLSLLKKKKANFIFYLKSRY